MWYAGDIALIRVLAFCKRLQQLCAECDSCRFNNVVELSLGCVCSM